MPITADKQQNNHQRTTNGIVVSDVFNSFAFSVKLHVANVDVNIQTTPNNKQTTKNNGNNTKNNQLTAV